jgi:hypothetical protein
MGILREIIARKSEGPRVPNWTKRLPNSCDEQRIPLVALIVEALRRTCTPEEVEIAVEYLRLIGEEGIEAFTELLAAESENA